jgi:protein-disulfide isomerase
MTHQQGRLTPPVSDQDHVLGAGDATVTLVEYGDFQCPHCYRAHPIVLELETRIGSRMRFVFRNFPLSEIHPNAEQAAESAESVAARAGNDAYWRMHHAIFEHQQDSPDALDAAHLARYAADSGADGGAVRRDLESGSFEDRVRSDFMSGVRSGVNGTPTFFINGVRFDGDWTDVGQFAEALEAEANAAAGAGG